MTLMLTGNGVSRGIALGKVRLLHEIQPRVKRKKIIPSRRTAEIKRFRTAVSRAENELEKAKQQLPATGSGTVSAILDSHVAMLHDAALVDPIENFISEHSYSSEWALAQQRDVLLALFQSIEDPYLQQRAADVEDTIARLLKHLSHKQAGGSKTKNEIDKFILVAKNLAPSDLIQQKHIGLIGAITEQGSQLSHTTIIAKNLNIPLIVNVKNAMQLLDETDDLIIDGNEGMVIANAGSTAVRSFKTLQKNARDERRELATLKDRLTRTHDRQAAQVLANLGALGEVNEAIKAGAEGVGLYRTESLFLNRETLPDEAEHLQLYRRLLTKLKGAPLVIRTMDVWSSKRTPGLEQHVPTSQQPALGLRAIRLCLRHPEFFMPQLRALLRASHYGPLSMLLPMVSSAQEVREILQMVETAKAELHRQRLVYDDQMPIGVMIEVPSAALSAGLIAPLVDFMAIGSNDLAQYTLAMDRDDASIQPFLDPLHPAVLQLIQQTIKAANQHDVPVSLCGEMAGEANFTRLLLGLGLRRFSMRPGSILEVKRAIMSTNVVKIEKLARSMLRSSSPQRTQQLLDKINSVA